MFRTYVPVMSVAETCMFLLLLKLGDVTGRVAGNNFTEPANISEVQEPGHSQQYFLDIPHSESVIQSRNCSDNLNPQISDPDRILEHIDTATYNNGTFIASSLLIVRLAQCRAYCLDKLGDKESQDSHLLPESKDHSLSNCWNTCQLIEEEGSENCTGSGGDAPCCINAAEVCLTGRQQACEFHRHQNIIQNSKQLPRALPVEPLASSISPDANGRVLIKWPASTANPNLGHIVYSLLQSEAASGWKLVGEQTVAHQMSIDMEGSGLTSDLRLRVLAVNSKGLVQVFSWADTNASKLNSNGKKDYDLWHFRLSSFVHQKFLVVTEVRWELSWEVQTQKEENGGPGIPEGEAATRPGENSFNCSSNDATRESASSTQQERSGNFLLTWEVYGGLVRGHLVTESNVVTISLWPDTSYVLQVGLIDASEVKVEKGESIMTQLEAILSTGGELPVTSKSPYLTINTTEASYPLVRKSAQERKRSAEIPESEAFENVTHQLVSVGNGKLVGGRSSSHFCNWNIHQHPSPTDDEVRACMLIWGILIVCLLLIFLMFLYFTVTVYLAMRKQIYFQKLHRTCSVSSIYSRRFYRLRKSIFRRSHYRQGPQSLRPPFKSSSLELLHFSDSSNSNSSGSDSEDIA